MMAVTARWLLTPMVIAVGIMSHVAADAGYVLVIPLGGVISTPRAGTVMGIAAAFAGPGGTGQLRSSSLDPLLQGISQASAQILDPSITLNPLNNYFFTMSSSVLIIGLGWYLTDRVVEPRLQSSKLDGDLHDLPTMQGLKPEERKGLRMSLVAMLIGILLLVLSSLPDTSAWRSPDGALTAGTAPLMQSIVPLIFMLFLLPGVVYGITAGTVKSSRDVIAGMTKAMTSMAYYLVIMFFIAQFIYAFGQSNLGVLLALEGAAVLKAMAMPSAITIIGVIILTTFINLFIGSSSAKWALLAPILVPMLMQLGISPDFAQAAYRVGDSSTNIITPLMPYFPLVVVYCQRYVKSTGIGTVTAMMLPYSVTFLVVWTTYLLLYWAVGLPLGLQATYEYLPG
jgi:aminobenzoyl-glutamate transport protein